MEVGIWGRALATAVATGAAMTSAGRRVNLRVHRFGSVTRDLQ
jgi:hypothetical protein